MVAPVTQFTRLIFFRQHESEARLAFVVGTTDTLEFLESDPSIRIADVQRPSRLQRRDLLLVRRNIKTTSHQRPERSWQRWPGASVTATNSPNAVAVIAMGHLSPASFASLPNGSTVISTSTPSEIACFRV